MGGRGLRIYARLVRPLLFRLPPERAQRLAETFLGATPLWRALASLDDARLHTNVAGIRLPNPIGLAAGYDKDCLILGRLAGLGFGYMVGGTVTAQPRPGNPRPRIVRNPHEGALVNSLGFPSRGLEEAVCRLERGGVGVPVLVSISGLTVDEFIACHRELSPLWRRHRAEHKLAEHTGHTRIPGAGQAARASVRAPASEGEASIPEAATVLRR